MGNVTWMTGGGNENKAVVRWIYLQSIAAAPMDGKATYP